MSLIVLIVFQEINIFVFITAKIKYQTQYGDFWTENIFQLRLLQHQQAPARRLVVLALPGGRLPAVEREQEHAKGDKINIVLLN